MSNQLETVLGYIALGWSPIPIPHQSKRPAGAEWQNLRITEADARQWFNGESQNVGVVLGTASGGLADVDLDSPEAVAAAPFFLPGTRTFGRSSKRCSHWLYKTDLAATEDVATIKLTDVQKPARIILEIRIGGGGKGAQTVFPGSVHTSGEPIEWGEQRDVATIDGAELKRLCARCAACALLSRGFPQQGGRHEGAIVVAGFLCRCGLVAPDIKLFVDALAGVTCQPSDKRKDMARAAADTAEAFVAGRNTFGLPKMKEVFGEPVMKKCVEWLGYRGGPRSFTEQIDEAIEQGAAKRRTRGQEKASSNGLAGAFVRSPSGEILRQLPENTREAILNLGVTLRYNEFMARIEITGLPGFGPELNDAGAIRLQLLIGETFQFLPADILFHKVIVDVAHQNRFHPVRDYLGGLSWDGVPRIDTWLSRYFGAEETPYATEVGRCFLVAMVARVIRPGCKQDYMLILEGPQGIQKSTGCKTLAGEEYFSDGLPDLRSGKDVSQHLPGKWLIEVGELSAMSKTETTKIKEFVTRTTERYRKSYGHYEVTEPRQCVFVGTTNDDCYLRDATGGRRFWPVLCGEFNLEALEADRDQLFAEAVHLLKTGASWWPNRHFEEVTMKPEQDARYEADVWEEPIVRFLNGRDWVSVCQIARDGLGLEISRTGTIEQRRIGTVLKRMKWWPGKDHFGRFYGRAGLKDYDVKGRRADADRKKSCGSSFA